ncbi:hypothetical protein GE061_011796 [Apolygus lucorum]|uniref:Probable deoxycytidylate deaminase n=1 Tax=Apolygus lucorum TaxID=248454 RepID=A0A8S9Y2L5_APOLU|nr:hypothetical protein GE061_011796 [Apolygus lucorum]
MPRPTQHSQKAVDYANLETGATFHRQVICKCNILVYTREMQCNLANVEKSKRVGLVYYWMKFLLGREPIYSRYKEQLSPLTPTEPPSLPPGTHSVLACNYYYERDGRREVKPPVGIRPPDVRHVKFRRRETYCVPRAPTPGKVFFWDSYVTHLSRLDRRVHCPREEEPKEEEETCKPPFWRFEYSVLHINREKMEAGDASQSIQCVPDSSVPEVREPRANLEAALQALSVSASREGESAGSSSAPRANYISWDDLFMSSAFLIAMRSKDPVTQVGACIVNEENKIVGMGYNGMPIGCDDKVFPWGKTGEVLQTKFMYVCHAEMNAVLNKNSADVKKCRIYVGLFPCNECAKIIIQSGIKEVIFLSDKNKTKPETVASKIMFEAAGVTYRRYVPKNSKITIDFSKIDWGNMSQLPTSPDKST